MNTFTFVLLKVLGDKCLSCDVCCRFPEKYSPLVPYFMGKETGGSDFYGSRVDTVRFKDGFVCPYFKPRGNDCTIYDKRPVDCRLYPFMVTYSSDYSRVELVLDNNCPYADELSKIEHEAVDFADSINLKPQDIGFINDPQPDTIVIDALPKLTELVFGKEKGLRKISIYDKNIFESKGICFVRYYLWKDILNVLWEFEDDKIKVFYKVGDTITEMIDDGKDYVYARRDMIELKGDNYKDKRNLCNCFSKNNKYEIRNITARDDVEGYICLYQNWAERKTAKINDTYQRQLIEDSFYFHKRAFLEFDELGLQGICITIGGNLAGYTFGCGIDEKTFCVLAEITDRSYKGINQFIFREFCRMIPDTYEYINTMDDSELEGLKKNKLSYTKNH